MNSRIDPTTLPWSEEAEQAVLGGLLLDPMAWDKVSDMLTRRDFFSASHGVVFETIGGMATALKPVDVITVNARLAELGKSEQCGGLVYLNAMSQSVVSAAGIRGYAVIVHERAMHRALMKAADQALTIASETGPVGDKLDRIAAMFSALERNQARKMPRAFEEIVLERLDRITELSEGKIKSGWATHFPTLDRMLNGGVRPGGIYILAARPSVGKSALAEALGIGFAKDGLPTLFLSQEMPDGEVADRAIASLGEIDYGNLQTGKLNDLEWGQLSRAVDDNRGLPFFVDDQAALAISDIRSKARSIRGLKILILDYLQLSASTGDYGNRNGEIEEISRGLKQLAKEMGIAILVLSQLNRKVEERPGKRPMLSDLRDSGAIEQDADVVVFLWPVKELEDGKCQVIGCDVPKNRQGNKGAFPLQFWGDYMRWGESQYRLEDLLAKVSSGRKEL